MVALLLMEIGVYKALEQTLALYSNVAIAWVGALVADLVINKPLGLRPQHMEFLRVQFSSTQSGRRRRDDDRHHRLDLDVLRPVRADGEGALGLCGAGGCVRGGAATAWATDGKYYIARKPKRSWQNLDGSSAVSASIRSSRRTWPPARPMRADLLAVLFARRALPRSLQAACAGRGTGLGNVGQAAAGAIYSRINSQFGHYVGVSWFPQGWSG